MLYKFYLYIFLKTLFKDSLYILLEIIFRPFLKKKSVLQLLQDSDF